VTTSSRTFTLGRACDIVEPLLARLIASCPALEKAVAAGGIRRYEPLVDELTIVACAADPESVIDTIAELPDIEDVLLRTPRRLIVRHENADVDLRIAALDEYGTVLHMATGSAAHLDALAQRGKRVRLCSREEDVYSAAGLPWIPPELRQGTGEIEAAATGRLPTLVDTGDIRGDLHMHTTYSDGQDSLRSMIAAASALKYEYIAITDHSERAGASRTVSLDALERQRDELARLREEYPAMAILHGIEVDIMPNGTLDFDDDVLAGLDVVLASLHDDAGQGARALTRRCIAAIKHPLVSVISHPANRIVGRRSAYPLDFAAVFEAAADAGTALEIDGAPAHLDMDGELARAAIGAGVTVTIDSDCHRAASLARNMRFGIGTARRGWVERKHVLNTRPLAEVQRFFTTKRRARS
jgi:DNA polymerase (family 10)